MTCVKGNHIRIKIRAGFHIGVEFGFLSADPIKLPGYVVDWSRVDKEDYLLAMERSPIKDIEIKFLLKNALTENVHDRTVYMKGNDHSYYYEGYYVFKTEELSRRC